MYFTTSIFAAALLVGTALAGSQPCICSFPSVEGGGCIRYTRGFDVTGVTTEIVLTFPQIKNECECIQACLNRPNICANYVYKFSTPQSVKQGYRTCTLYSNFNIPTDVQIDIAIGSGMNKDINAKLLVSSGNNPQKGGPVPQAFKDKNLNTTADPAAVSGPVWQLANGMIQC